MRVYLPATWQSLGRLWETGQLSDPPLTACAVTPALREWYVDDDLEELEYAALTAAATASLRLLAASPAGEAMRRVVLAADVADAVVAADPTSGRAHVAVSAAVPLESIASVHVDEAGSTDAVLAAAAALTAADAGDDDAGFVLDELEAHELLWYATQEIPDLVADGAPGAGRPSAPT